MLNLANLALSYCPSLFILVEIYKYDKNFTIIAYQIPMSGDMILNN